MIPQDAKTDVRISRIKACQYAVTLLSDRFIWKAYLAEPDGDQYDENDFDLWPGEAKTITAVMDREDFVPYLIWIGKEEDA